MQTFLEKILRKPGAVDCCPNGFHPSSWNNSSYIDTFDVVGSHIGKIYRISYGSAANVHLLDEKGKPLCGYCFVPNARLVPGDIMLAQKIALETDENSTLALANKFPAQASRY
jgi:hypothetical protein